MRSLLCLCCVLAAATAFCQQKHAVYIEVRGNVDPKGNVVLTPLKAPGTVSDPDFTPLNAIIQKYQSPVPVINALAEQGWELVSAVQLAKDRFGRPNDLAVLYYFKRGAEAR